MRRLAVGAAGIVAVMLGGVLLVVNGGSPTAADVGWAALMTAAREAPAVTAAKVLATIGGTLGMVVVTLVIIALLLVLRRRRTALAVAVTVILSSLAVSGIKVLVARARPSGALMHLSTFSYPSGHAASAAALSVTLALAVPRVWSWVAASVWMAAIALSRTYLEVHWLTDAAAGLLLGASFALVVDGALRIRERRRAARGDSDLPAQTVVGRPNVTGTPSE